MRLPILLFSILFLQSVHLRAANPTAPNNLRASDKVQPVGTDDKPFFGWYVQDVDANEIQSAYQVVVASSENLLTPEKADLWDSKKVNSRQQNYVYFGGKALAPATRYYWKVRTWDKDGNVSPWSAASYFDTGLFTAKDWNGAVWIKRDTKDANDYTYYRKTIKAGAKPVKRATVYLTAFHNYELFIDGKLIGKGPGYHYPQYAYYNAYDVTSAVKAQSTFAAMTHWYGGGQGRAKGDRGFLLKLIVEYKDGTKAVFGTDNTWKHKAVEAYDPNSKGRNPGEGIGYIDVIDSRKIITDWNSPKFNDKDWQPATVLGAHPTEPFTGELQPDLTRSKETKIQVASIKSLGKNSYLIDLGKVYAGMPEIVFEGGKAGDTVSMQGGFVLKDDGTVNPKINQSTNMSYFFVLNGKKATFRPELYLGYRYLQVNNSPVSLTKANTAFVTRYFELQPEKANFTSSDKMLNQVWDMMIHSLTLGAQEGFVDTPTREKGEFLGDAFSQGVASMLSMGERSLNHRMLLEFIDSQDQYWPDGRMNAVYPNNDGKRDIPDFTQQYLMWAWDYYIQTGNLQFLKDNYAKIKKVATYVDAYTNVKTGLIHNLAGGKGPYEYGIIDWPATMRYGYDMTAEARTVINAYAYTDFIIISKIAEVIGNTADVALFKGKADAIKTAFNKYFINAQGVYADGLLADGSLSTHVSQHANMFPLAVGLVPQANIKAAVNAVKERKMSAGMVTVRFLTEALGENAEAAHLLELYTNPQWDGWAQTISKGGTATWEAWDALETNQSMCHPWGTAGLSGIQRYVLGIKAVQPQYDLIEVKPLDFKGKLTHASGKVNTDKGVIDLAWKQDAKKYELTLTSPVNVTAEVYIPKGTSASAKLKVDGKEVTATVKGNYLVVENVGSGIHTFVRE
ncbi:family 78 glycoside hydrolase catalytic domain [Flavobacterium sp. Sd200]|uniref:family 78 glycoside hydrolase catalytic domain n=1 Tax=Flavobacterium sp. Sd200 TaxID=2692211 RepID=UPI001368C0E9|nr:family 78 glycoside hydrolase catalytic domain [Flavobacterium sp. Sd200]MXN90828.1 family 78 glycoside hydrolase catalytic domain [Flavobacterium sp. Sd200]